MQIGVQEEGGMKSERIFQFSIFYHSKILDRIRN